MKLNCERSTLTKLTVDHPHGGGRGKSKGNRHPVTPWGRPVRGSDMLCLTKPEQS